MNTEPILATEASTAYQKATENSLAIGTRLNDFEIPGVLGEGGLGIVYLAFDHSLQRTVAIKEYMPGALAGRSADTSVILRSERHKATFDAGLKSFINEARLLAQFDHPSLVKVYRFWEENKTAYMVMRHYDGHTLKKIRNKRPKLVTEAWLKFIFKQILEALDTLYKSKILHRDISPDNIIVQKNGVAVLLDFGSARQIIGDMTQGLTVILKPGYAPVEQYSDETEQQQGSWTDIYALAAVMYFAIIKAPPPISVGRVIKDTMTPLQDGEYPGYSAKFLKGIDQALAIQPQDRPQSIDEFRILLGISAFASARKARKGKDEHGASVESGEAATDNGSKVVTVSKQHEGDKNVTLPGPGKDVVSTSLADKVRTRPVPYLAALAGLLVLGAMGYFASHRNVNSSGDVASTASLPASAVTQTAATAAPANPPVTTPEAASVPAADNTAESKADPEILAWEALKDDTNATPDSIHVFLKQYPNGKFTDAAQTRLKELNKLQLAKAAETATGASAADKTAAAPEKAPGKLNLKFAIKPWGTVFVDGVQQGASPPLKHLSLPLGKHKIRVTNPGFPDLVTEVDSGKTNSVTIDHEFTNK